MWLLTQLLYIYIYICLLPLQDWKLLTKLNHPLFCMHCRQVDVCIQNSNSNLTDKTALWHFPSSMYHYLSLCCYCHPGPFMHHHFPLRSSWLQTCPFPSQFQWAASGSIPPLTCSSVTVKEKSYICTLSHETAWLISWQAGILWLWYRRAVPEPDRNDVIHYCNDASAEE